MEEMFFEGFFLFLVLVTNLCSQEEQFSNFGKRPPKELSYQVWLKSTQWLQRRMFEFFFSIFNSGGHFVQRNRKNQAIMVEDLPSNNPIKFGWYLPCSGAEMSFEVVVFFIFSSGSQFVQQSGTIWVILVEDLPRNNPINFGRNPASGYRGDAIWSLFYF